MINLKDVERHDGVRGGAEQFVWSDVKGQALRDRECYLGQSTKIGIQGKFGQFYTNDWYRTGDSLKNRNDTQSAIEDEKEITRFAEKILHEEAMGLRPKKYLNSPATLHSNPNLVRSLMEQESSRPSEVSSLDKRTQMESLWEERTRDRERGRERDRGRGRERDGDQDWSRNRDRDREPDRDRKRRRPSPDRTEDKNVYRDDQRAMQREKNVDLRDVIYHRNKTHRTGSPDGREEDRLMPRQYDRDRNGTRDRDRDRDRDFDRYHRERHAERDRELDGRSFGPSRAPERLASRQHDSRVRDTAGVRNRDRERTVGKDRDKPRRRSERSSDKRRRRDRKSKRRARDSEKTTRTRPVEKTDADKGVDESSSHEAVTDRVAAFLNRNKEESVKAEDVSPPRSVIMNSDEHESGEERSDDEISKSDREKGEISSGDDPKIHSENKKKEQNETEDDVLTIKNEDNCILESPVIEELPKETICETDCQIEANSEREDCSSKNEEQENK